MYSRNDQEIVLKSPFITQFPVVDRWIDCLQFYVLFNSNSSYQDDGWVKMKGCAQKEITSQTDFKILQKHTALKFQGSAISSSDLMRNNSFLLQPLKIVSLIYFMVSEINVLTNFVRQYAILS